MKKWWLLLLSLMLLVSGGFPSFGYAEGASLQVVQDGNTLQITGTTAADDVAQVPLLITDHAGQLLYVDEVAGQGQNFDLEVIMPEWYSAGEAEAKLASTVPVRTTFTIEKEEEPQTDPGNSQQPGELPSNTIKATLKIVKYGGDVLLQTTQYTLPKNSTVYDLLQKAADEEKFDFEYDRDGEGYVVSIDGDEENQHGAGSGWVYKVNGVGPGIGIDAYRLGRNENKVDKVEFLYTLDLGKSEGVGSGALPVETINLTNLENDIKSLKIGVSNQLPLDQVDKTVVVRNAGQKMSATELTELKQKLEKNEVNLQQKVTSTKEYTFADEEQEVQVNIPDKAVSTSQMIQVKELEDKPEKGVLTSVYEFSPRGLQFEKPIFISMKVPADIGQLDQLALVWLNEETHQWIPIPAVFDAKTGIITGQVNHFTKFAVVDRGQLAAVPEIPVKEAIRTAIAQILKSGEISDWEAFALGKAGEKIPASYLPSVEKLLKEKQGKFRKITDYERMVLGILAAGGDPTQIAGYHLIEKIYNHEDITVQGSNGVIFALIALDSGSYTIPADARWTKEKLLGWLLENQNQDGSWPLVPGDPGSVDITGMALVALAPYQEKQEVAAGIQRAVAWLSAKQTSQGGFVEYQDSQENSESISQVIHGLTAVGVHPLDPRFQKAGGNLITHLLSFQQKDGGFAHLPGMETNSMATEQALTALIAYDQFLKKGTSLFEIPSDYVDVQEMSGWAKEAIYKAKEYKLMLGVSTEVPRFAPKRNMTRAEFTKLIINLLGDQPSSDGQLQFQDVKSGAWYYGYVKAAKEKGIINGVTPEQFRPNEPVTREQMAIMISKALQLKLDSNLASFTDQGKASGGALPYMQAVYQKGLISGYNGYFYPKNLVTREMAAVVAVNIYNMKK